MGLVYLTIGEVKKQIKARDALLRKCEVLLERLGFVPMDQETDQLVFLVGLQHDVGDGGCGAGHADLGREHY